MNFVWCSICAVGIRFDVAFGCFVWFLGVLIWCS